MKEMNFPTQSAQTLVKATLAAVIIAVVVFLTALLPAEYGIDPTGLGKQLGLTVLSQPVADATEVSSPVVSSPGVNNPAVGVMANSLPQRQDEVVVIVPANKGIEYKFYLAKGGRLKYQWQADIPLYHDFHGEPEGDTTGFFESYALTTADNVKGTMTTPFAGIHGWFWRNTTANPVQVTLKTEGDYRIVGLK